MNNNDIRETSLSERTLSGLGWSYLSTFVKAFLSLLVLVILARLLTPVDFGLLAIAWIFIMLGNRFGQAFVGPAVIQRAELTDRHIQVGFTLSVLIGIAMAAMIWLLAPFIGDFFREPTAAQVLQALSIIFVINGIGSVPAHLLRRDLRFRELMVADVLAYCAGYGFTAIVLAFQGYGVWSLVWGEIMHKVVYSVMVIRYTHKPLHPRWALPEATDLLSRGAGFSLARSFEFIARQGGYFVRRALAGRRSARVFHTGRQVDPVAQELRRSEPVQRAVPGHGAAAAGAGTPGNHLPARLRGIVPGGIAGKRHAVCVRPRDRLGNPGRTVGACCHTSADPGGCRPVPDVRYPEFRGNRRRWARYIASPGGKGYTRSSLSAAPGMRAGGAWRP